MRRSGLIGVAVAAGLVPGAGGAAGTQPIWQADLQIRGLVVSETKAGLTARLLVGSELGEAVAVRVEVLLPVGVGLVEVSPGCSGGPNPAGVRALQARVICTLGNLAAHAVRELRIVTTSPPPGVPRGFGVVALSDTPDPRPNNNYSSSNVDVKTSP